MRKNINKILNGLNGAITIPADKSISHRAVMFASLAKGKSIIKNFSNGQDPHSSLDVCQSLGVDVELNNDALIINSNGHFFAPTKPLNCGNSGTTIRLMSGILAWQNFSSSLISLDKTSPYYQLFSNFQLLVHLLKR